MPAPLSTSGAGTLRRSLFPALAWAFMCALVCPAQAAPPPLPNSFDSLSTAPEERGGTPLTLAEAFRRALGLPWSLAERTWSTRAEIARAEDEARSPNPVLEASVENFGGGLDPSRQERTLSVGQALDLGGRRRALHGVTRALERKGSVSVEVARRGVMQRTGEAFVAAWRLERRVALLRRAEASAREAIGAARERTRIGAAPVTEGLRAEGEWTQRAIERRNAEAELAAARRTLALEWGGGPSSFDTLTLEAPAAVPALERPGLSPGDAPELREAAAEREVSAARLRAARAARIPEVTALGGVRHLAEEDASGFLASLSAPIPLWNRGQSLVAAADADRRAAEAHERLLRLQLERQIAEARERMTAAREAWDLTRDRAEPAARQALEQLASGYRRGRFTYLDYLEGQRTALDIQLAAVEAASDYWRARLDLERLTGASTRAPGEVRR